MMLLLARTLSAMLGPSGLTIGSVGASHRARRQ
jgi:hypothetical protein